MQKANRGYVFCNKLAPTVLPDVTFGLDLVFYTSPNTASLVGLTEGSITGDYAADPLSYLQGLVGTITPAVSVPLPVPEPSPPALLALGLLACLPIGFARRRVLNTQVGTVESSSLQ